MMNLKKRVKLFKAMERELFKRVVGGFAAFRSEEWAVGDNWHPDGPLPETLGMGAILEQTIVNEIAKSPLGGVQYIEPEDKLFDPGDLRDPDLELSTTPALRDAMCKMFPSVVVGYLTRNARTGRLDRHAEWVGQPVVCLGLLRWLSFRLRRSADIFEEGRVSRKEYSSSMLEVKAKSSGHIMICASVEKLTAAGYADLARGRIVDLMIPSSD